MTQLPAGTPRYGHRARRADAPPLAPSHQPAGRAANRAAGSHARRESGMVGAVVYLVVLVCTAAGVYLAWREGSGGGGRGAVVAGSALLVGAVIRAALPARLAGLLASRHRVTDVLTLTAFGAGLLVAGLVLPRLGPLSAQGRMAASR
jgi:Protein of unknown function (DUF3017)